MDQAISNKKQQLLEPAWGLYLCNKNSSNSKKYNNAIYHFKIIHSYGNTSEYHALEIALLQSNN